MKIRDQITADNWMKGGYHNIAYRDLINIKLDDPKDPLGSICRAADRCCLAGWIERIYNITERPAIYRRIIDKLFQSNPTKYYRSVQIFNDDPITTFKDIEQVVKDVNV